MIMLRAFSTKFYTSLTYIDVSLLLAIFDVAGKGKSFKVEELL